MAKTTTGPAPQGNTRIDCTCKNLYQDSVYGPGKRVATIGAGKRTCTSCGKVYNTAS